LGSTYVKLGQFIASSPSLFPADYVSAFQGALDAAEPVAWADIESALETAYGGGEGRERGRARLREAFSYVDQTPLASASVAQVHAATLRSSGRDVVIKVLRPGVADALAVDTAAVLFAAKVLEAAQPALSTLSLAAVAADLRESVLAEADFEREARSMAEFRLFLEAEGLESVAAVPFVYGGLSTSTVLVMERFVGGVPLTDEAAVRAACPAGTDPKAVVLAALETWALSVARAPTFHADLHAARRRPLFPSPSLVSASLSRPCSRPHPPLFCARPPPVHPLPPP